MVSLGTNPLSSAHLHKTAQSSITESSVTSPPPIANSIPTLGS